MSSSSTRATSVRYQPDESPPAALALGCGVQLVMLGGAGIVLIPTARVIGIATGSLVAGAFGLYDAARVAEAPWIGVPRGGWLGIGLDLGAGRSPAEARRLARAESAG